MDIVKQITILLWILGIVLITPPVLRNFDIDVQTVYRKVLALPEKTGQARDGLETRKTDIDPSVFNELFSEENDNTVQQNESVKQEFEKMISGLERIAQMVSGDSSDVQIQDIPAHFHYDSSAQNKQRWLPPPPGFMTGETFNYLIYREQQPVSEKLKTVLDNIHGNLMLDLTPFTLVSKPNKILVMLFENKNSYMGFTKRPAWSGAASDLRADTMYVLEGPNFYPLSVHELTHLYFDGYFLPSISPLWLSEGMAVYMQIYATRQKPAWVDTGIRRILSGQYISLEDLFDMDSLASLTTQQAELWYTQAFSVVDYLLNSHSRDEFYRFCNELKAGTPVYQALYRAYGIPFNKVSVLQNVWLYDLARKMRGQNTGNAQVPATELSSTQTVSV
ncbi:MAG: hypothetical protein J6U96_01270, partial [Elusimicrobiaceae bacterium]|nr:hypothetical protein [Elusimicrobiaceae bacterium]